jgi:hypothetical protein
MIGGTMHQRLKAAYQKYKEQVQIPDALSKRLSPPLLIQISQSWIDSHQRVLIIGQETLGWRFQEGEYYAWPYQEIHNLSDFKANEDSVEALLHGYREFEFALHQPENYRSPFWQAYRQTRLSNGCQIDGFETSVLWSNLFRSSLDGGSVVRNGTLEEIETIRDSASELLRTEIGILQPTAIIFFTGPVYNDHLYAQLPGCKLIEFNGHDVTRTCRLAHPALPESTIRTYHPNYLMRSRNWDVVNQVIDAASIAPAIF